MHFIVEPTWIKADKLIKKPSFYLLAFFLLNSCILGIEEENFVKVEKKPNASYTAGFQYSYDRNEFYQVKDTVWLEETIYFKLVGEKVYGYEVLINGESVFSEDNNSIIKLEKGKRSAGAYKFTIIQYVKSGTRSLADNLEVEYAVYQEEYVLIIGSDTFEPEITNVVLKDGSVQLSWKPYTKGNFQSYEIRKMRDFLFTFRKFVVQDQHQTSFIDSTYVGESVLYEIRVNKGGEYLSSEKRIGYFRYHPETILEKISENKLKLSWNAPPFYKNVKYYTVKAAYENGAGVIQDNISPETLSIEFEGNPIFGKEEMHRIVLNAKVNEYSDLGPERVDILTAAFIGKKIPSFKSILHSASEKAFYLLHASTWNNPWPIGIYKLNGRTLDVVDSILYGYFDRDPSHLIQSPNGKYLYLLHFSTITEISTEEFFIGEEFNPGKYFHQRTFKDNFSVSNNNFVVMLDSDDDVKVIDFENKNTLLTARAEVSNHISADGGYFLNGGDIYSFNGSEFIKSGVIPYAGIRYVRFLNREGEVFIATEEKIIIYDIYSSTEISSFHFVSPTYIEEVHLDLASMIFGVSGNREKLFVNIETGEKLEIEVEGYLNYKLEGDVLFSNGGLGLKNY